MQFKIVHSVLPFSFIGVLLVQGCVTPQEARENAERALRKTEDIQAQQNALENRTDLLEQYAKKLEQKIDANTSKGYAKVRETLTSQEAKSKEDRDRLKGDVNKRLEEVDNQIASLRTELLDAIQSTNATFAQKVDKRFDSLDVLVASMLQRIEELEKRLQTPRKK
jgi:uncharacterized protein YceH (UPF0502 family)